MTTKLFERLVTKFSIKVNDLAKYLEISKATIYNYRNLEKFSDGIDRTDDITVLAFENLEIFGENNEREVNI